ncbi:MAG: type II secretory pathway component PulM [Porticoccaceae bacterium]|jgi:type II secretory pathway component PulM
MKVFMDSLRGRLNGLQPRERQLLLMGLVLLFFTAIYVALTPITTKHNQLISQSNRLESDLQWLQQQSAVVSRLANGCGNQGVQQDSGQDSLTKLVRRNQLRLSQIRDLNNGFELRFSGADANRILRLTHQVACSGFNVQSLKVERTSLEILEGSMEVIYVED